MPELPDLHMFAKNLKKSILSKSISSVEAFNVLRLGGTVQAFQEKLVGTSIQDIVRDGKELHFKLANNNSFSVHLMLNGKFFVCPADELHKINSKIIAVCFEDGTVLAVSDFQGLCKVTLNPRLVKTPDALSEAFTFSYFMEAIKKNARVNIKAFLINQHIVKGIGNAYVDEILWKADISPESVAGRIPEENLKILYDSISIVLLDAISSIERIAPDIINGEERSFLKVHNSRKKFTDDGEKILIKRISSKSTYYTQKQKLYI